MPPRQNPFGRPPMRGAGPPRPRPQVPPIKFGQPPVKQNQPVKEEASTEPEINQGGEPEKIQQDVKETQQIQPASNPFGQPQAQPQAQPPQQTEEPVQVPIQETQVQEKIEEVVNEPEKVEEQKIEPQQEMTQAQDIVTEQAQQLNEDKNDQITEQNKQEATDSANQQMNMPKFTPPRPMAGRGRGGPMPGRGRGGARPTLPSAGRPMPPGRVPAPSAKTPQQQKAPQTTRPNTKRPQIKAQKVMASPFGGPAAVPEQPKEEEKQEVENQEQEETKIDQPKAEEPQNQEQAKPEEETPKAPLQNPFAQQQPPVEETKKVEVVDEVKPVIEEKQEVPKVTPQVEEKKPEEPVNTESIEMQFDSQPHEEEKNNEEQKDKVKDDQQSAPQFQTSLNDSVSQSSERSKGKKKKKVKKKKLNTHRVMENEIHNLVEGESSQVAKLTKENLDQIDQPGNVDKQLNQVQESASQKLGEQMLNNVNTIKSKSLTSQIGPDAEKLKRLQDALQTQKESNNLTGQKLNALQTEHQIITKKYQLIQDENQNLREDLKKLKAENLQIQENTHSLKQAINQKEKVQQRYTKEKDEHIAQLNQEIDNLKQERDLYKDRMQRALRDSQTHREHLERQINTSSDSIVQNIRNIVQGRGSYQSRDSLDIQNSASNQQEINLQRELMEMKNKYERILREQRDELNNRTRDLQRVERKNIKYRENNRILSDAVQALENRNITPAAGSGSNQNEIFINYQNAVNETNQDLVEGMRFDSGDLDRANQIGNPTSGDQNESSRAHTERRGESAQDQINSNQSNDHGHQSRMIPNTSSYFDNTQDEATGGEGHSNIVMEEQKQSERPSDYLHNHQIDQQSSLGQDRAHTSNQQTDDRQNNNQSINFDQNTERDDGRIQLMSNHQEDVTQTRQVREQNENNIFEAQVMNRQADESGGGNFENTRNSGSEAVAQVQQQVNQIQGSSNIINSQLNEEVGVSSQADDQSSPVQAENNQNDNQSAQAPQVDNENQDSPDDDSRETNEYAGEDSQDSDATDDNRSGSRRPNNRQRSTRIPEAGSGNYNERQGFSGADNSQRINVQPGAIPSQGQNVRQTGSSAGGTSSMRYPGTSLQNEVQEQYGTGSSGASGMNIAPRSIGHYEEQKQSAQQDESQSRNIRQLNQQPSSGANGIEGDNQSSKNNRQGRQGGSNGNGAAPNSVPRGNAQSDDIPSNPFGDRGYRSFNRGRGQSNNQQTSQGQNSTLQMTTQQSSQSHSNQRAPVSLSQEREQQNASITSGQNYSSVQAAVSGNQGSDVYNFQQNSSVDQNQAVQQVNTQIDQNRRQNQFANTQNQQNVNVPASSQSNPFPGQRRENFSQGAAHHREFNPSQSSQMIPASTASHNQFSQSAVYGNNQFNRPNQPNMMSFDSGSTSFMGSVGYPVKSNQQASQDNNRRPVGHGRVPYTQINQVSSPPSNQVQQMRAQEEANRSQRAFSTNQQNPLGQQEYSIGGPGAVGAPPSNTNQNSAVSPGSLSDPGQGMIFGQQNDRRSNDHQNRLPSVPENQIQQEEEKVNQNNQQPAALRAQNFGEVSGCEGGSGDHQDNMSSQRQLQTDSGNRGIRQTQINFNNRFENQNIQGSSQLTPPRRNNDSKKTSGANTPNKDGADTPPTHQNQSMNLQNRGGPHGRMPRLPTSNNTDFRSAVTAGLNQHLSQQDNGGNQQNYVHNLTSSQLFSPQQNEPNSSNSGGASIIDQLSAAASHNRGGAGNSTSNNFDPSSLFEELGARGNTGDDRGNAIQSSQNQQLSNLFGDSQNSEVQNNEGC